MKKRELNKLEELRSKYEVIGNSYRKTYNKISKKLSAHEALATLIQLKNGIDDQYTKCEMKIGSFKKEVLGVLEYLNDSEEKKEIDFWINESVITNYNIYLEKLDSLLEKGNISTRKKILHLGEIANKASKERFKYWKHKFLLEDLIQNVLIEEYPIKLRLKTEFEYQEKSKEEKIFHRPYDESAPQNRIREFVNTILEKAKGGEKGYNKFIHSKGEYKGLPNKNQIKKALIKNDLVGELADRTIGRRIDAVLEDMS